jgi:hypothetical protein
LQGQLGQAGLAARERGDVRADEGRFGTLRAGLGAQERAYGANTDLAGRQLGFMGGVSAPYPDAGQYAQMAALAGQQAAAGSGGRSPMTVGGGGGGLTTTQGGPWQPDRLRPGQGAMPWGGGGGYPFGLNAGVGAGPTEDRFGNRAATPVGFGGGGLQPGAPLSQSQYAPPAAGFGGGGGSGAYPQQYDQPGSTMDPGLQPGGPMSQSPYAPPATGFGGGFGSIADPQQMGGGGGLQPTQGTPYAPRAGGFGGGYGGAADWENDYLRLLGLSE